VGGADALGDLDDPPLEQVPDLGAEHVGAAFEARRLRDHADRLARFELGHADHRDLLRVDLAGNEVLQVGDDLRADHERVDRVLGLGDMAATPVDDDLEDVAGGHHRAGPDRDLAEREPGPEVLAEHPVDALHRPRRDHLRGAAGQRLLAVLEEEADLAGQRVGERGEDFGDAEHHRGVAVVAAGVHHAGVLRGEGEAGRLLDRQRVVVGADRDPRAGKAAAQVGDDAGRGRPGDLGEAAKQ